MLQILAAAIVLDGEGLVDKPHIVLAAKVLRIKAYVLIDSSATSVFIFYSYIRANP